MPSNSVKKGLGKGLEALIPQGVFTGGRTVVNIGVDKIVPNPYQPRTVFSQKSIAELAESIKSQGVVQPILARMRKGFYELIAGERRLRAVKLAGLTVIPAIIKDFSDEESMEISLIENLQREDLNPIDEADAYRKLQTVFNLTQVEISKKVGKDRSTIANVMRLLELPIEIQKAIKKGGLSAGHARALLAIEDNNRRLFYFQEIIKNRWSVRDVEVIISGEVPKAKKKPAKRKKQPKNVELLDIQEMLTTHLGTKVRLYGHLKRLKITVEFYSQEDLERLISLITE
jgi:ParB family chromosome partitioning protein